MDSLGQYLKQGREEVGVSLEELSQRTKIRLESLQFLETDDLDSLPTDPYVRGFVKLVCRELGLMPQEGLHRYETLLARSGPDDEMTWAEENSRQPKGRLGRALEDPEQVVRRARRFARVAAWSGAVVVLAVVAWGGSRLVGRWTGDDRNAGDPGVLSGEERVALVETQPVRTEAAPVRTSDPEDATATDPPPPSEGGGGDAMAVTAAGADMDTDTDTDTDADADADAGVEEAPEPVAIDMPLEEIRLEQQSPDEVTAESILVTVAPAASEADRLAAATAEKALQQARQDKLAADAAEQARLDKLAADAAEQERQDKLAADTAEQARLDKLAADAAEQTRQDQLAADAAEQARQDNLAADAAEQERLDNLAADAAEQERQDKLAADAADAAEQDRVTRAAVPVVVPPPAAGDRLVLEIEALRSVQITVLLDGIGYPRTRTLAAGSHKAWKADSLFLLSADDGGALRVQLSGTDLGVPGTSGQPLDRLPLRASRP